MRLQQYLLEDSGSGRMKPLKYEEFLSIARDKCMNAVKAAKSFERIFRGDNNYNGSYFLGDGTNTKPRTSRNTSNHYTLWMDNHPSWSDYPKRSKSFICSSDYGYASSFGSEVKLVLPYDNVDIGVCVASDLWSSFPRVSYIGNSWDMSEFNSYLNTFMQMMNDEFVRASYLGTKYDTSWNILRGSLKDIDNRMGWEDMLGVVEGEIENEDKKVTEFALNQIRNFIKSELKKNNSIYTTLEYLLNPDENGFYITDTSKQLPTGKHEMWMEGPVLTINMNIEKDIPSILDNI